MAMVEMETIKSYVFDSEKRESHAKAALEMKYRKEFEITKIYSLKFDKGYYEVQAYMIGEPEIRFLAAVDMDNDRVSDSYVEKRICKMISQKIAENLDGLPGYYYLYTYALGPQPLSDDIDISIQDYVLLDSYNSFQIELFVSPEAADDKSMYRSIVKMFEGLKFLAVNVTLYFTNEEGITDIQAYLEDGDTGVRTFSYKKRKKGFYSLTLPYEMGCLKMTESEFALAVGGAL